ncbi:CapA family protein [Streptomyces sp. LaPpAH-108]|uniref:CapA family protein n=1 Tax=Streptomyces sp. LaPpAH-108 TaxID=1155714 RepID=UPI00037035C5|nr:CapA family protein [Streptomyces sp. LaPpAH-108]
MIGRKHQVALALTAVLAAAAACQNQERAAPAAGPQTPVATRGFTLVASGSVVPHSTVAERAAFDASGTSNGDNSDNGGGYDFGPMLAAVEPAVSDADLALCRLDPVPGDDSDPAAASLPQLARALAATGYDSCATAAADALVDPSGVPRTLNALDGAGIRHAGTARTQAEAGQTPLLQAGPAKVAHLSYTYDPGQRAGDSPEWTVAALNEQRVIAGARAARKAGADVVVLSLDWGDGWQDAPNGAVTALAERLTAAKTGGRPDVDLILGADGHLPQAYGKVNGVWVVYGSGDQIGPGATGAQGAGDWRGGESTTARFTFAPPAKPGGRWEVRRAEFLPQFYDQDSGRLLDVSTALTQGADLTGVRDRIKDAALGGGGAKAGLTMAP